MAKRRAAVASKQPVGNELIVFSEDQRWHKAGDTAALKVYQQGEIIPPYFAGVKAATYPEAHELLTGRAYQF